MKYLPLFMIWAVLSAGPGCVVHPVPPPAGAEKFKDYYAGEVFIIEQTRLEGADSVVLRHRLDSLRSRFAISSAGRDTLLRYYQDSLPRWESFLTEVLHRLEERGRASGRESPTGSGVSTRSGAPPARN